MAIIKKITQPGDFQLSTLNGKVRLDGGNNRLVAGTTDDGIVIADDSLAIRKGGTTYVDGSNGNLEVFNNSGDIKGRLGYRDSDTDGAIDVAKPNQSL